LKHVPLAGSHRALVRALRDHPFKPALADRR
jgi:hypothetical protein